VRIDARRTGGPRMIAAEPAGGSRGARCASAAG
jgi:hypothetical protein